MNITEPNTHFLVVWEYDSHHGVYGVFSSTELAVASMLKEKREIQAELYHHYVVREYKGSELIDEVDVSDILEIDNDTEK